jgi:hypothetical protein
MTRVSGRRCGECISSRVKRSNLVAWLDKLHSPSRTFLHFSSNPDLDQLLHSFLSNFSDIGPRNSSVMRKLVAIETALQGMVLLSQATVADKGRGMQELDSRVTWAEVQSGSHCGLAEIGWSV